MRALLHGSNVPFDFGDVFGAGNNVERDTDGGDVASEGFELSVDEEMGDPEASF